MVTIYAAWWVLCERPGEGNEFTLDRRSVRLSSCQQAVRESNRLSMIAAEKSFSTLPVCVKL